MGRKVHLQDRCTLRFPGRGSDFADGVEIGVLAAQMDMGAAPFSRWVSSANLSQIRIIAQKLGWRLTVEAEGDGYSRVALCRGGARPRLKLVHSA